MKYDPEIHHRRSIRLKEYDYSQGGAYFLTICTWHKECLFGDVINGEMRLSSIGKIVQQEWCNISKRFLNVELDAFIIMPNHLHGIIIVGAPLAGALGIPDVFRGGGIPVGAPLAGALDNANVKNSRAGASPAPTLGDIVGSYKSLCVFNCRNNGLNTGKLWQRNYFERVIRDGNELHAIRQYIINNPLQWDMDVNNPVNL